jgi:hypothetical protein
MKRALIFTFLTVIVGLLGSLPSVALGSGGHTGVAGSSALSPSVPVLGTAIRSFANQPQTVATPGFTYQGSLKDGASPANGQYDFTFALYDDLTTGNQVGSTIITTNQTVTNGLFTLTLDFGAPAFQGDARWLQIAVRPAGQGGYTTLSPRQALTAAPYALGLRPGAIISGTVASSVVTANNMGGGSGVNGTTTSGSSAVGGVRGESTGSNGTGVLGLGNNGSLAIGVWGKSTSGYGVRGESTGGTGVYGQGTTGVGGASSSGNGVSGSTSSLYGSGVSGISTGSYGFGVYAQSENGPGLYATSTYSYGVEALNNSSNPALYGSNLGNGDGVRGYSASSIGIGVYGQGGDRGVFGISTNYGVSGVSTGGSGYGVFGTSFGSCCGIYGQNSSGTAIEGNSPSGYGVTGFTADGYAVYGSAGIGWAGYFDGNVRITGSCCGMGEATTQIDDPLDPANKYLNQSVVASPDMLEVYRGHVTLDADGSADVQLPPYFEALNRDFDYQLTPVGAPMPDLYVAQEVQGNTFKIAGGKPGSKVSWQVTGMRQDPYAQAHPIQPEQDKPADEKGKYLHPQELGKPVSQGVDYDKVQRLQQSQQPPSGR